MSGFRIQHSIFNCIQKDRKKERREFFTLSLTQERRREKNDPRFHLILNIERINILHLVLGSLLFSFFLFRLRLGLHFFSPLFLLGGLHELHVHITLLHFQLPHTNTNINRLTRSLYVSVDCPLYIPNTTQ